MVVSIEKKGKLFLLTVHGIMIYHMQNYTQENVVTRLTLNCS